MVPPTGYLYIPMKLMEKLFGTYSERQIKRIEPIAQQIEDLGPLYAKKTDEELSALRLFFM